MIVFCPYFGSQADNLFLSFYDQNIAIFIYNWANEVSFGQTFASKVWYVQFFATRDTLLNSTSRLLQNQIRMRLCISSLGWEAARLSNLNFIPTGRFQQKIFSIFSMGIEKIAKKKTENQFEKCKKILWNRKNFKSSLKPLSTSVWFYICAWSEKHKTNHLTLFFNYFEQKILRKTQTEIMISNQSNKFWCSLSNSVVFINYLSRNLKI